MEGQDVELPAYVLCFRVAEKLGGLTTPMDVAPTLDPQANERSAAYWVQAAINMLAAEHEFHHRKENDDRSKASIQKSKSRALGRGG